MSKVQRKIICTKYTIFFKKKKKKKTKKKKCNVIFLYHLFGHKSFTQLSLFILFGI